MDRPNITCPRCKHRHPADRVCGDSAEMARLAAQVRQLQDELQTTRLECYAAQEDARRVQLLNQTARNARRDEFAMRAPPAPEWFMPTMPEEARSWDPFAHRYKQVQALQRLYQWPRYYAEQVIANLDAKP